MIYFVLMEGQQWLGLLRLHIQYVARLDIIADKTNAKQLRAVNLHITVGACSTLPVIYHMSVSVMRYILHYIRYVQP